MGFLFLRFSVLLLRFFFAFNTLYPGSLYSLWLGCLELPYANYECVHSFSVNFKFLARLPPTNKQPNTCHPPSFPFPHLSITWQVCSSLSIQQVFLKSKALTVNLHLPFQLRRQARERREYIYKKANEAQERSTYDRKQKMKDALAEGKQLPTELRREAREVGKDLKYDEAQTGSFSLLSVSTGSVDWI